MAKPMWVNSKMTKEIQLPNTLTVFPTEVAKSIYKAQQKNQNILYVKPIWRLIMAVIKCIPEWKFKGMNL